MNKILKKILKLFFKIIKFLTPHGIYKFFSRLNNKKNNSLNLSKYNDDLNKEKKLNFIENFNISPKDNDTCVVLGNGPSLKTTLESSKKLNFIKNYPIFCVNSFPNTDYFFLLKPEYLVYMDPFLWAKNLSEQFKPEILEIKENITKANWKINIFMPKYAEEWNFFKDISNKNINLIYINTNISGEEDFDKRIIQFKKNEAMPQVQNVLVACLYLGLNIGFKKIYLFGADHSWHENLMIDNENILNIRDVHFYDKKQVNYTKAYSEADLSKTFSISSFFLALSKKFSSYMELEEYSKVLGTKIFNASEKSYIDAFEKIKI